jgi:hypothetical protein
MTAYLKTLAVLAVMALAAGAQADVTKSGCVVEK